MTGNIGFTPGKSIRQRMRVFAVRRSAQSETFVVNHVQQRLGNLMQVLSGTFESFMARCFQHRVNPLSHFVFGDEQAFPGDSCSETCE